MYPPNAHLYDADELQGTYIHRALTKELGELTETFSATKALGSDEKGKSVVLSASHSLEKHGTRCLSVVFDKAKAHIAYDDFSHGYNNKTTVAEATVDVSGMREPEAVQAIVKAMAATEPLFGSHVRETERLKAEEASRVRELQSRRGYMMT